MLLLSEVPTPGPAAGWLEEGRNILILSSGRGAVQGAGPTAGSLGQAVQLWGHTSGSHSCTAQW